MEIKDVIKNFLTKNVNDMTEKKNGFTYLSWALAWEEVLKVYPNATYKIIKNENGLPYFSDDTGAICFTEVTIEGIAHEMWLPVMDGANKAMKKESYTYKTKFGEKSVEAYTMFDVNKTIMRCLVKNLAMFGLGLYIYAGEDLPTIEEEKTVTPEVKKELTEEEKKEKAIKLIEKLCVKNGLSYDESIFKKMDINELTEQYNLLKG